MNRDEDFKKRKGKCWAVLKSYDGIWRSSASEDTKRQLFYALVEPIMTYGMIAWPMTVEYVNRINGQFGAMLRYALGLKSAFISRHTHSTERLYAGREFLSTLIVKRRMALTAHCWREHIDGRRLHPFLEILLWEVPDKYKRHSGGQKRTLQSSMLKEGNFLFVEELHNHMADREKSRRLVNYVATTSQETINARIHRRRELAEENELVFAWWFAEH
jgi:hypothetical protein